jgi:hypothetical protein
VFRDEAVVDQDRRLAVQVEQWRACQIKLLPSSHLGPLTLKDFVQLLFGDRQLPDRPVIQNLGRSGNGAHSKFRLPWDAEFAGDHHVQRQEQAIRHSECNRHSPARQSEDHSRIAFPARPA